MIEVRYTKNLGITYLLIFCTLVLFRYYLIGGFMSDIPKSTKRISLTIQNDVLSDVDYLSSCIGVTRSSLISEFLRPTVSQVKEFLEIINAQMSDGTTRRDPAMVRQLLNSMIESQANEARSQVAEGFADDAFKH